MFSENLFPYYLEESNLYGIFPVLRRDSNFLGEMSIMMHAS